MRRPPFCPNRECEAHIDPRTAEAAELSRRRWFKRNGSYHTLVRGSVTRFKCLVCGRGFSEQTFSLDYYVKRTIDYDEIRRSLGDSSSVRAISRRLGCSCDSVTNRCSRFARQCISAHTQVLGGCNLSEDLAADGFESFTVSQYFPNNIHLLVGSRSQAVYFSDYLTLRRSGRMTAVQKRKRAAFEKLYPPDKQALTRSFGELLEHLHSRMQHSDHLPLTLATDKKQEYRRALAANAELTAALEQGQLIHTRVDSRAARTKKNPLFAVNYLDRELRKDLAEHVRETVRFARNVNHCTERLWIYFHDHNTRKRYRINDPVGLNRTHLSEAGLSAEAIARADAQLDRRRRFLSFESLEPALDRVWRRAHRTPLKGVAKKVLREIDRQAHAGAVDLEAVKQKLGIDHLINDRPQYLPKYALA
jgi:transposase-like protein